MTRSHAGDQVLTENKYSGYGVEEKRAPREAEF